MAIEIIRRPRGSAAIEMPGPLQLPPEFDRQKYASKWVKVGPAVAAAAEREWIPGTTATADGWEVWRNPKTKKPHKVALQSGTHVLLCRDASVQKAVNAICGNVGKERLLQERAGETIAGVEPTDPGMLSDHQLQKVFGREEEADGDVKLNPVPDLDDRHVKPPVATTIAGRRGRRTPAEE